MTEYEPDDHHGDAHDAIPHVDLPDHHPDDAFAEHRLPALDDLGGVHAPIPDELHFPGDDTAHDAPPHAGDDADPAAPWPDDDRFTNWLGDPAHAPQDDAPGADAELRDQLADPPGEPGGLPSPDALVDWTLRNLGDAQS